MIGRLLIRWQGILALGSVIIASQAAAAEFDQTHALFNGVLTNYVKDALVDYAANARSPYWAISISFMGA
jgi:hypothetical protein